MKKIVPFVLVVAFLVFGDTAYSQTFKKVSKYKWNPLAGRVHQSFGFGGGTTFANGASVDVVWTNPLDGSTQTYTLSYQGGVSQGLSIDYHWRWNFAEGRDFFAASLGFNPIVQPGIGVNLQTEKAGFGLAALIPILVEFNFGHAATWYDMGKAGFSIGFGPGGMIQMAPGYFGYDYGGAGSLKFRFFGGRSSFSLAATGLYGIAGLTASTPTVTLVDNPGAGQPAYTIDGTGGNHFASLSLLINLGGY